MSNIHTEEALADWLRTTNQLGDAEPALFALLRLYGNDGKYCLKNYSKTMETEETRVSNYMPLFMRFFDLWGA